MPNHFHLVVYTKHAESLSKAMHWISSSYVRYYNKRYKISGVLWQGRYKSFIVQEDNYLLILLKYVEANPKRAKIVKDCMDYEYSLAYIRVDETEHKIIKKYDKIIDTPPIELPNNYREFINEKENKVDLKSIRNSIDRQAPPGDKDWQILIAKQYGIESTLNPRGRPWNKDK